MIFLCEYWTLEHLIQTMCALMGTAKTQIRNTNNPH